MLLPLPKSLLAGKFDVMVFLTGVGARTLLEAVETRFDREQPSWRRSASSRSPSADQNRRPCSVNGKLPIAVRAAEPNTLARTAQALECAGAIEKKRIAVQEYGRPNRRAGAERLVVRGASVEQIPVYRWALPEDVSRCGGLDGTMRRKFDMLFSRVLNSSSACSRWPIGRQKRRVACCRPAVRDRLDRAYCERNDPRTRPAG